MKTQLYIVSLVIVSIAACNYSAECWPRGQGDSEGAGSGTVDSTGPGNPGDNPDGTLPTSACNEPEDDGTTELSEWICPKVTWGSVCSEVCADQFKIACPPSTQHPKKPEVGRGALWKCCGCQGQQQCKYIYSNGDSCTWRKALWDPKYALCGYEGGI